jgi:hypothetical protein
MAVITVIVTMLAVNSVLKRGPGAAAPALTVLPTTPATTTGAAQTAAASVSAPHAVALPSSWQGGPPGGVVSV